MCDAAHLCPPAGRLHAARASGAPRAPPPSASHASPSCLPLQVYVLLRYVQAATRRAGAPARARRDPSESNSAAAESSLLIIMNNPAREVARARLRRRRAAGIHAFIKNRIIYYKMICYGRTRLKSRSRAGRDQNRPSPPTALSLACATLVYVSPVPPRYSIGSFKNKTDVPAKAFPSPAS
eukprot:COSAG02_NODE_1131_length_14392_cov_8.946061_1_plen_181_part_00